jgi:hypothetical protein
MVGAAPEGLARMAALAKALAMVGAAPEGHATAVITMRGLDAKSLERWLASSLPGIEFWP